MFKGKIVVCTIVVWLLTYAPAFAESIGHN